MSGQMQPSSFLRRTSRSSGSQPACHSSRVEKPKSHHNSPRTMERRKTTTESKLYATLDDHYRMMFGAPEQAEQRPQPSRPLSWHPSSSHFQPEQSNYFEPMPQQDWSRDYSPSSRDSHHGSDFYSLSTRNSVYEPITSNPTYPNTYGMQMGSDESDYSWQSVPQHTPGYVHSTVNTPTTEPLPWYLQQWAQENQAQSFNSHHGSTDFLPIQRPTAKDEEMEEDDSEKLVALGLYDTPEPSLTWGGLPEGTGKGLKLEETWQPPENDEEDGDDASSEASVDEPSPPLLPTHQQAQHLSVHVKPQTPGSMEGQSFFFDEDETLPKDWWFRPGQQTSLPVRDAGLGYGWL
ncbi:hypothetical protein EJ02DRAFT_438556 [Clathrospora elynae]|uniref:Uncharacterized protein n=1 Tax=Clathrospora elynae TaxID=706981 RepID=A0A6A5SA83_9PLEO|nr:hypothetical protein EJ02DRAFT_438556 [Clathrospora elynae]